MRYKKTTIEQSINCIKQLSPTQKKAFMVICDYWSANDQLPTMDALAERLGYKSPKAATDVLGRLERAGLIERNESKRYRFARIEGINLGEIYRRESQIAGAGLRVKL